MRDKQKPQRPERVLSSTSRVGAIDVGANSVKYLVADWDGGELSEIEQGDEVTRLAGGLAAGAGPSTDAVRATRRSLERSVARCLELGAGCVAAAGGLRLLPDAAGLAQALGSGILPRPLSILSGGTEGVLSLLGMRAGAGWPAALTAFDVGGASTEISFMASS